MNKLFLILALLFSTPVVASFSLGVEAGQLWVLRNDLQRPQNDQATRVALDEIDSGPESFYRVEGYYRPSKNHGFRFLYAPLTLEITDRPSSSVIFNGQTFAAGSDLTYTYKFNSYRATWFYAFWGHGESQLNLGFTAKIRDADTRVNQSGSGTNFDNVGFVPLLFFEFITPIAKDWSFYFGFDGLAGGPGRAFDFAFKLRRDLGSLGTLGIGTRTLEGGVDNDDIYNFSFLQYGFLEWSFTI